MHKFKINNGFILFFTFVMACVAYWFLSESTLMAWHDNNIIMIVYYVFFGVFILGGGLLPYILLKKYKEFDGKTDTNKRDLSEKRVFKEDNPVWKAYQESFHGKKKTRANADLYFNTGAVMDEIAPFYFKSFHFISETFIGLGILGTFLGFSMGMEYINDSNNAINEIMHLISNDFKTAFDTSIVGIFFSIIYKFLIYNPVIREFDYNYRKLSDELDTEFYMDDARMYKIFSNQVSDSIEDFSNNMKDTLLNFSNNIANELQKAVIDGIQPQLKMLSDAIQNVALKSESITERLEKIPEQIENIYEKIEEETVAQVGNFRKVMDEVAGKIDGVSEKLIAVPAEIDKSFRTVSEGTSVYIKKLRDQINESLGKVNDIAIKLQEIPDLIEEISDNIIEDNKTYRKDMFEIISQLADKFRKEISNSTEVMKGFKMELEKFNDTPEKFNEINEEYERQMSSKLDILRNMNSEFSRNYKEIASEVNGVANKFKNDILETVNNIGKGYEAGIKYQLEGLNAKFNPMIQNWNDNISGLDSAAKNLCASFEKIENSAKEMLALAEKERCLFDEIKKVAEETEKIKQGFVGVDNSIGGILQTINAEIQEYIGLLDGKLRDIARKSILADSHNVDENYEEK